MSLVAARSPTCQITLRPSLGGPDLRQRSGNVVKSPEIYGSIRGQGAATPPKHAGAVI
jgi:hypothetical protein